MEFLTDGSITSPRGFLAGATYCGIKRGGRDLVILYSGAPCQAAAVFTANRVKAAPLLVTREHLACAQPQAVVVNSGNANACTGEAGYRAAREMTELVAGKLGLRPEQVLVASTGIIGVPLPMEKIRRGMGEVVLSPEGGHEAARGIMTTDAYPKEVALRFPLESCLVTIGAMAKGAGMIHPNLATLLVFITTDAAVSSDLLPAALRRAADVSFNLLTVDGDTSTNDTVLILANGLAGNEPIRPHTPQATVFQEALNSVATTLAKAVARNAEGASKLIEVQVEGAASLADAGMAARAVAGSSLVKCAVYGSDPNWGRILCAVGYSGAQVQQERMDIAVGDVPLMVAGEIQAFDRDRAREALSQPEVHIRVNLHLGDGVATAWGCDLTEKYVTFNSEYST